MIDFSPFPKIPRWKGDQHIVITEKIDGTNAQIVINEDCTELRAGSRSRWITPEDDNFGFARWCAENKEYLLKLGKGQHFGEWWGAGIQRTYGMRTKQFSLFNTLRWGTPEQTERLASIPGVGLVPILYQGPFETGIIEKTMAQLNEHGSYVAPFMNPEGVVVYMPMSRSLFKMTFDGNESKYKLGEAA